MACEIVRIGSDPSGRLFLNRIVPPLRARSSGVRSKEQKKRSFEHPARRCCWVGRMPEKEIWRGDVHRGAKRGASATDPAYVSNPHGITAMYVSALQVRAPGLIARHLAAQIQQNNFKGDFR